jgi:hypothetical protein
MSQKEARSDTSKVEVRNWFRMSERASPQQLKNRGYGNPIPLFTKLDTNLSCRYLKSTVSKPRLARRCCRPTVTHGTLKQVAGIYTSFPLIFPCGQLDSWSHFPLVVSCRIMLVSGDKCCDTHLTL